MRENFNDSNFDEDDLAYQRASQARRERRLKKRRHERNMRILFVCIVIFIIAAAVGLAFFFLNKGSASRGGGVQNDGTQGGAPSTEHVQIQIRREERMRM